MSEYDEGFLACQKNAQRQEAKLVDELVQANVIIEQQGDMIKLLVSILDEIPTHDSLGDVCHMLANKRRELSI